MSPTDLALPTASPREVGVDAAGVTAFLDALADAPDQELHSLALLRHGRVCAQGWWAPYGPGIVSSELIKDPQTLKIATRLNGRTVQVSLSLSDMS